MLRDHAMMLTRLEAEEQLRWYESLLAAGNRRLSDADQRGVLRRLERQASGQRQPRAPKFTADFLRQAGAQINPEDSPPALLGPDGRPIEKEVR